MNVPFEMDYETWETYYFLLTQARDAESKGDAVRLAELTDQLKSLPGFPAHAHPTEDRIVPVPKPSTIAVIPRRRLAS